MRQDEREVVLQPDLGGTGETLITPSSHGLVARVGARAAARLLCILLIGRPAPNRSGLGRARCPRAGGRGSRRGRPGVPGDRAGRVGLGLAAARAGRRSLAGKDAALVAHGRGPPAGRLRDHGGVPHGQPALAGAGSAPGDRRGYHQRSRRPRVDPALLRGPGAAHDAWPDPLRRGLVRRRRQRPGDRADPLGLGERRVLGARGQAVLSEVSTPPARGGSHRAARPAALGATAHLGRTHARAGADGLSQAGRGQDAPAAPAGRSRSGDRSGAGVAAGRSRLCVRPSELAPQGRFLRRRHGDPT